MKRVVFVNGTARCGSTLVDLILGNDPRGFSLGEVSSWFRPWRTTHFDIKCGCGIYPCPVWEELKEADERDLYSTLLGRPDVDFVVDSSKRLTWIIDQNIRLMSEGRYRVFNLFLYKDPVSLHHSRWKRGDTDVRRTAREYHYYERAIEARVPFVSMNYDWLISHLDVGVRRVCDLFGLGHRDGRERFWEKQHHHLWGSFGPRKQLFAENPSIYREEFGEDYRRLIPEYERVFGGDRDLQRVLEILRARDVQNLETYPALERSRVRRPLFYYRQRWRDFRLRLSPQWMLDKEASTIQEWRV